MEHFDPNIHPVRPDLAAERNIGRYDADKYAPPMAYQVLVGVAPLRKIAAQNGEQLSQAFFGDYVDIYEIKDGFGWGQMLSDDYVGWFDVAHLVAERTPTSHRVNALRTYVMDGPSVRANKIHTLTLNSEVTATENTENGWREIAGGLFVPEKHIVAKAGDFAIDPALVATKFAGAPYQWGGKESIGLDCSGLVQMAFWACGVKIPRDSYLQHRLGDEIIVPSDLSGLKRNDIICWKGHVGLMVDAATLVHANGFWMETTIEPLIVAEARIAAQYGPLLFARRLGI